MVYIKTKSYDEFVEKFKPKLTTDDCYTPAPIYDAVLEWVRKEYEIAENMQIERPFYPGGDYKNYCYKDNSVVVDNPPFSIFSKIVKFYQERGIPFFLFAPFLTVASAAGAIEGVCIIVTHTTITYENGAKVGTCFVTNMDKYKIRSASDLQAEILKVDKANRDIVQLAKHDYPYEVITVAMLGKYARRGLDFNFLPSEVYFTRQLDSQKPLKKGLYGAGFLISEQKALEQKALEQKALEQKIRWVLSDREKEIIKNLGL